MHMLHHIDEVYLGPASASASGHTIAQLPSTSTGTNYKITYDCGTCNSKGNRKESRTEQEKPRCTQCTSKDGPESNDPYYSYPSIRASWREGKVSLVFGDAVRKRLDAPPNGVTNHLGKSSFSRSLVAKGYFVLYCKFLYFI